MKYFALVALLFLIAASCHLSKDPASYHELPKPQLTRVERSSDIADCEGPGTVVYMGFDENLNRLLDGEEVETFYYICDGKDGSDGENGTDGYTTLFNVDESGYITQCENSGLIISYGLDKNRNFELELEELEKVTYLCDGKDGVDGEDGLDAPMPAYYIVDIIDPCGDSGDYDEVIIELQNGEFIAYLEDKGKKFLSLLQDGIYKTTDKQKCRFRIEDGEYYEL